MGPDIVRVRSNTMPDHVLPHRAAQSAIQGYPVMEPFSERQDARQGELDWWQSHLPEKAASRLPKSPMD